MTAFAKIHARVQRLWQIRERDIPIIKIDHEVEDVAEIFARLNQAGTRVKEADVVLALAAVRNPGWVRQDYLPFRNDLEERGWDLDAGIFIRTMTGIGRGRARLKEVPKDFWNPDSLPSVVIKSGVHRRKVVMEIYRNPPGVGCAVDVVVVTPEDIERYGDCPALIIEPAIREGRVIYAAWRKNSFAGQKNGYEVSS